MYMADLEEAVAAVLVREIASMDASGTSSAGGACRACIEQVLAGETPTDRPSLICLQEHGYLVQEQGRSRLQVSLFEDWLRQYLEGFPTAEC